ncbi:unnamed protein product [Rotaria sp. Silwood2]|nr:unnamed protein product [Rotaria sp. Silwood2]
MIYFVIAQNKYSDHNSLKFHDINGSIIGIIRKFYFLTTLLINIVFFFVFEFISIELNKQNNELIASIYNPILTSTEFQLKTEQVNSTTIRIHIIPNGYIGVSRINCHWSTNITYRETVDLYIGEKPGLIELNQSCQAYDRRYVQCIFRAPIIGRAFRNGFPQLYEFAEFTSQKEYRHPPELIKISNDNKLFFNFLPHEKNRIPKKISMNVSMTVMYFGSASYSFDIKPVHTTNVDFRIANISSNHLTIVINHNNTGTISERLCAGYVDQVDHQKTSMVVQDIKETLAQKILINGLHSSTQYNICLYCFYERTDQSFEKEICHTIKTKQTNTSIFWLVGLNSTGGFIVLILIIYLIRKNSLHNENIPSTCNVCEIRPLSNDHLDSNRCPSEIEEDDHSTTSSDSLSIQSNTDINDPTNEAKYQSMKNFMEQIPNEITPPPMKL